MTGLVGWWPLHRTVGDAIDLSGEGNHGTITGATRGVAGRGGLQAFSFDGTDDELNNIPPAVQGDSPRTISVWYRQPVKGSDAEAFYKFGNDNASGELFLFQLEPPNDYIGFRVQGGNNLFDTSNVSPYDGKWHHVVLVFDGPDVTDSACYFDNSTLPVASSSTQTVSTGPENGFIGSSGGGGYFGGVLCDVRVYDRALSPAEVSRLYDWGGGDYAQPPSDLLDADAVSYWPLDESSGDAIDQWGSNDGTVTGATQGVTGVRGTAYSFDGTDDEVVTPLTESGTGVAYTLAAWFTIDNLDTGESNKDLVSWVDSGSSLIRIYHQDTSEPAPVGFSGIVKNDSGTINRIYLREETDYTLTTGEFYHTALSIDANGQLRFYLNGRLIGEQTGAKFDGSDQGLHIGFDVNDFNPWPGDIDDVRVYSRALSPAEIYDIYRYGTFGRDLRKNTLNAR